MRQSVQIFLAIVIVCLPSNAFAFELTGGFHPENRASFYYKGYRGSIPVLKNAFLEALPNFDNAFLEALDMWNGHTDFTYSGINQAVDPCEWTDTRNRGNNTFGWEFASSVCGTPFGEETLAITATLIDTSNGYIWDTDISFNNRWYWSINGEGESENFKETAAHELGHALGLDHTTDATALMYSYANDSQYPRTDDINGFKAIYGLKAIYEGCSAGQCKGNAGTCLVCVEGAACGYSGGSGCSTSVEGVYCCWVRVNGRVISDWWEQLVPKPAVLFSHE